MQQLSQSPPKPQHAANSSSLSRSRQRFRTARPPPKWKNAGSELMGIPRACRSRSFAKILAGKRAVTCCSTILRIACGTFFGVYEVVVGWCPTVAETSQTLVAPSCAHVRPVRRLGAHGVCGRACSCWKTPVSAQSASASVIRYGRQRANHLLKRRGAIQAVAGREPLNDVNALSCAV